MRPLYTANIAGREQPVCCAGCSIAATLIAEKGLTEFYRRRTEIDLNIDAQQWGNRAAAARNLEPEWPPKYDKETDDLTNDPEMPLCAWALAQKT